MNPIARPKLVSRECQTDELEGDPSTSQLCFNNASRIAGGTSSASSRSVSVGTGAGVPSAHPSSPLARTSAVSPVHARPLSSASSVSGASDASSPTSSVIMASSWQGEEVEDMDLSPSPSSNGEAVRNRELSESEESEDEVTFNTIKRGATVNSMSPPQQQQQPTKQSVVECQTEGAEGGGTKKQNGIKRVGIPPEGEQETKNGVGEGNKCNSKVPDGDGDDTIVDDDGGGGGLVNGETEMEEGSDERLRISDSPEKTQSAVDCSSSSNNESDKNNSKDDGGGDSLAPQTDQQDS